MKRFFTFLVFTALLGITTSFGQLTRQYAADDIAALLTDLTTALNGDVFELTTSGGIYKIDTLSVEIHANVTVKAAEGLAEKPILKLVKNDLTSIDYIVRLVGADVSATLNGLVLEGDTANTKYAIRTAKVGDISDFTAYDDVNYDGSIEQSYDLYLKNCDIHGIKSGSDGRGIILYPGTRARLISIDNCTFSTIERDAIDAYADTDDITASGHWVFADSMAITNTTFNAIGREAIQIRTADTSAVSMQNKVYLNHVTFDNCAWNNSDPNKYKTLKIDYAQVTMRNCLFTNDVSTEYVTRLYNAYSSADYIGVYNIAGADTIKVSNDTIAPILGTNMFQGDPLYADAAASNFMLGAGSPFLGVASDGYAIGDLKWDASKVPADNVELTEVLIGSAPLTDLSLSKSDYRFGVAEGTTAVPVITATAKNTAAVVTITQAPSLPGEARVSITSEDGSVTKEYTIFVFVESSTAVLELANVASAVYPNPSSGTVTISGLEGTVTISNIIGNVLSTHPLTGQTVINGLKAGVYVVTISNGAATKSVKLLVQ